MCNRFFEIISYYASESKSVRLAIWIIYYYSYSDISIRTHPFNTSPYTIVN